MHIQLIEQHESRRFNPSLTADSSLTSATQVTLIVAQQMLGISSPTAISTLHTGNLPIQYTSAPAC